MEFYIQWTTVLIAVLVTDICWAYYIRRVKDGKPLKAAMWAVFLFLTGAIGAISYIRNPWFVIPAAIGAFIGTYIAVWLDSKAQKD